MYQKIILLLYLLLATRISFPQTAISYKSLNSTKFTVNIDSSLLDKTMNQFFLTSDFLDAALNSINTFNSLIKKENYRTKIASFNNPTSSDMGFNLEYEVHSALKPLLLKAKNVNHNKFGQIISSIVNTSPKTALPKPALGGVNPVFSTLISIVGTLTIQEKRITKEDLDSFITKISKYFVQYEKLNQANLYLDQTLERIDQKLKDLQFDLREYILDIVFILNKNTERGKLKNITVEELHLKYLDKYRIEKSIEDSGEIKYPTDGIKSAKDIAYSIQKIFIEYQKIYDDNYKQIRSILQDSKLLGKNINLKQLDVSLKDLEFLYNESKLFDSYGLRLTTLFERLKTLAATDQITEKDK